MSPTPQASKLIDNHGRQITYLRLSVTDRCDFRCVYCMSEKMTFLPKKSVLSLEELALVAEAHVSLGVRKIRLTGGEPLVRNNVLSLVEHIGKLDALNEFTMTTNGAGLVKFASSLRSAGLNRINISLDSLKPKRFSDITRTGKLSKVLSGIEAAQNAGFSRTKLNTVILKGENDDEVLDFIDFCIRNELDISFIEEMPLGAIDHHERAQSFFSSEDLRGIINQKYTLTASDQTSGGPSKYYTLSGHNIRVGFISPLSHNFCDSCNRVRVSAEGRLLLCLGNEHSVDLLAITRANPKQIEPLRKAIADAMQIKPLRHYFDPHKTEIVRFMNMTGG